MTKITVPTVALAAEWDADDPWIERIWFLMKEVIRRLDIDEEVEDKADFMADRVWEKLNTARNSYQKIKLEDFTKLTSSQQKDEYEHLYSALWATYKDCLQSLLKILDYDIGFMFMDDKNFEKWSLVFKEAHPDQEWLVNYARTLRGSWQNDLAANRNAQHTGDFRNVSVDYNDRSSAKELFEAVCYVVEGIFVLLAQKKLSEGWLILMINDDETVFGRGERFALKHYLEITSRHQGSA